MKWILVFLLTLVISDAQAQNWGTVYIDFTSPNPYYEEIAEVDSTLSNNLWQIWHTEKEWFGSGTRGIMTDTVNSYSSSNQSIFTVAINNGPYQIWRLIMVHAYDTDSLNDGGHIDISFDYGATWEDFFQNIVFDSSDTDTYPILINGKYTFSGKGAGSVSAYKPYVDASNGISYIRFVFESDSIFDDKEGWDILLLWIDGHYPMLGIEQYSNDNLINIYPNPTSEKLIVKYNDPTKQSQLTISDVTGKIISIQPFPKNGLVDVSNLSSGIYYIRYSDERYQAVKQLSIIK